MSINLIQIIDDIIIFGELYQDIPDKETILEEKLIRLYSAYFDLNNLSHENSDNETEGFDYYNIRMIVDENFPDFGYYNSVLNIKAPEEDILAGMGDSVDDLTDIIIDLIEIKTRYINFGIEDAVGRFLISFETHIKQHLINLLNYIHNK